MGCREQRIRKFDCMRHYESCNFFFQAEDGIRDSPVTGVQTCALPICTKNGACGRGEWLDKLTKNEIRKLSSWEIETNSGKIGRASCRERV